MTTNADFGTIRAYNTRVQSSPRSGADPTTSLERANMIFDETRDNLTDTEAQSIEADAHAETREAEDNRPMERRVADSWWATRNAEAAEQDAAIAADWAAAGYPGDGVDDTGDDPTDPEHDEVGDADTDYDIEFDDEDDGQPSEYEEWQDFMGGDDWDHGQCDEGGY